MIYPLLYSREPATAAAQLKANPSLADVMCKGLASRLYSMEKLGIKEASALVRAPWAGAVSNPILEELTETDQAAKKAKNMTAKPTPISSSLGQD